ncbi:MAG TPA: hypothetical protein VGH45_09805 [Solirubrobacteraceae bacterium]|jgi:hypothetical protein
MTDRVPVLERVLAAHALDSKLRDVDLADYHVPFDAVHGYRRVESELARAVGVYERTAIIGPIGCGKTSLARYVLDRLPEQSRIAPIWISVAFDGPEVVTDPRRFAAHVVQAIVKQAQAAVGLDARARARILAGASERRQLPGVRRRTGGHLSAKWWALGGQLGRDVTRTLEGVDLQRPLADMLDAADAALAAIAAHRLDPVLVVDDSDTFTRLAGIEDRTPLIASFFGPVLRAIADLRTGIVVAVHERYLGMSAYRDADDGLLETPVVVPELVSGHVERILSRRVEFAAPGYGARDLFTDAALEELYAIHRGPARRNMRLTLSVCHQSLLISAQSDLDRIDSAAIAHAARQQNLGD